MEKRCGWYLPTTDFIEFPFDPEVITWSMYRNNGNFIDAMVQMQLAL